MRRLFTHPGVVYPGVVAVMVTVAGVIFIGVRGGSDPSFIYEYEDDGRGLVFIDVSRSGESVYDAVQAWRDDHPDLFRRHVSITTSTWGGVIISYIPADSVKVATPSP